jgi:spoIIIJ-associated protein
VTEPDQTEQTAPAQEAEAAGEPAVVDLEREADIAADYVEVFLDVLDLAGDIDMDVEGVRPTVSVVPDPDDPTALDALVGRDGVVLDALQELTRLAVAQRTGQRSRLMLDIAGHRQRRREELAALARDAVEQVRASGEDLRLAPMTPFERKVVHDTVAAAGLVSESEGEEPKRRVVVRTP